MATVGGVDLSKKIGPVPVWVIVAGGGLAVAYWFNRSFASSGADSGTGTPTIPIGESGIGGTPGGFVPAPDPGSVVPPGILDNEQWAFEAVGWLVGNGYNPIESGIAVRKYLDGEKISSRELTMITVVIRAIGVPPNVPVGGGVIVTPAPAPAPKPAPAPAPAPKPAPAPAPKPAPAPAPAPVSGRWFKIPVDYAPRRDSSGRQYGVMDRLMKSHSYPLGVVDVAGRTKIWYHQNNVPLRTRYNNDWSKLRGGETIFIPEWWA